MNQTLYFPLWPRRRRGTTQTRNRNATKENVWGWGEGVRGKRMHKQQQQSVRESRRNIVKNYLSVPPKMIYCPKWQENSIKRVAYGVAGGVDRGQRVPA